MLDSLRIHIFLLNFFLNKLNINNLSLSSFNLQFLDEYISLTIPVAFGE